MDQNNSQSPPQQNDTSPTQPPYEQPPAPNTTTPPVHNPGETLGIISIIMTVPLGLSIVGIILGVISRKRSKEVGASTTLGTVGMWLGIIGTVLWTLAVVGYILLLFLFAGWGSYDSGSSTETYQESRSSEFSPSRL